VETSGIHDGAVLFQKRQNKAKERRDAQDRGSFYKLFAGQHVQHKFRKHRIKRSAGRENTIMAPVVFSYMFRTAALSRLSMRDALVNATSASTCDGKSTRLEMRLLALYRAEMAGEKKADVMNASALRKAAPTHWCQTHIAIVPQLRQPFAVAFETKLQDGFGIVQCNARGSTIDNR
jgi:hypothetical protein